MITTILMSLLLGTIICSGCIAFKANSTWGEKKLSMESIKISNNTTGNRSETNESRYYVSGYVINKNPYDALEIKLRVTTYTYNGSLFAVNDKPFVKPKNIPANGVSYFYANFSDPNRNITKYQVNIISAKGEY